MRPFELVLIINPELDEEALTAVVHKVQGLITNNGGQDVTAEGWGKRRLAYEIRGYTEGFYVVVNFNAEPETLLELERVLRITDEVIRYLLVRSPEA